MSFQVNRNAHSQAIDTANRLDSQDSAPNDGKIEGSIWDKEAPTYGMEKIGNNSSITVDEAITKLEEFFSNIFNKQTKASVNIGSKLPDLSAPRTVDPLQQFATIQPEELDGETEQQKTLTPEQQTVVVKLDNKFKDMVSKLQKGESVSKSDYPEMESNPQYTMNLKFNLRGKERTKETDVYVKFENDKPKLYLLSDSAPAPEAMPGHRALPGKPKSVQRLAGTLSFGEKGAQTANLDRDNCRYIVTFENGKLSEFSHEEYVKIFGEERPPEKFDF